MYLSQLQLLAEMLAFLIEDPKFRFRWSVLLRVYDLALARLLNRFVSSILQYRTGMLFRVSVHVLAKVQTSALYIIAVNTFLASCRLL